MKKAKRNLFVFGILAVFLAGCFSPISVVPPAAEGTGGTGSDVIQDIEPFLVSVTIGGSSRSIAGPTAATIKGDIRNILQLIVVDEAGTIVAFDEARRHDATELAAVLNIPSIEYNKNYHFLLLMGHWERDYVAEQSSGGAYVYKAGPPTLLAAGLQEKLVTGDGTITVTMWPIVVDTKFTTSDADVFPIAKRTAEPAVGAALNLLPVEWGVKWTLRKGASGNGLADLIAAQKIPNPSAGDNILLKSKKTILRGDGLPNAEAPYPNAITNEITLAVGAYASGITRIGKGGSTNFELEYIPYNQTAGWAAFNDDSVFNLSPGNTPVWIIRNGINSLPQDASTNFNNLGNGTANGNGAISFAIEEVSGGGGGGGGGGPTGSEYLLIRDGAFIGPADSMTPAIRFTTEGYTGDAVVYYAVVDGGAQAPGFSDYTKTLGPVVAATHQKTINLDQASHDYDVYVLIMKGGEVSDAIKINTAAGEGGVGWNWGDEPYLNIYVSYNYGNDLNDGLTSLMAVKTISHALTLLEAAYATDTDWPNKGDSDEAPGGIIMREGVITGQPGVTINGGALPTVVLREDAENPINEAVLISLPLTPTANLNITNGAHVILDGTLIVDGGTFARTVSVTGGSTFTMNSGTIMGSQGNNLNAGGVYVENSTFTMNGGTITGNRASGNGIDGGNGGGVYVASGTFTMNGGTIKDNTLTAANFLAGGGVFVRGGTFTMTGGFISGHLINAVNAVGAGVCVGDDSLLAHFKKTGGVIYGHDGDLSSNKVIHGSWEQLSDSHAAWAGNMVIGFTYNPGKEINAFGLSGAMYKTYNATGDMYYNFSSQTSGWDG
jgi:hypothetical protein